MSGPIEWGSKKSSGSDKLLEPHPDFSENKLRAKRFIDNLKRESPPGVSAYMSDNVFFIEAHRGKARYSAPISLHQDAKVIQDQAAEALKYCREFAKYNENQRDKHEKL